LDSFITEDLQKLFSVFLERQISKLFE